MGCFKKINAFLVFSICFDKTGHNKWCSDKIARQIENDLERGFVKHRLNIWPCNFTFDFWNLSIMRVPNKFFGMRDFPYLRLGIREFKAKSGWDSGLKVCAEGRVPKIKNNPRDYGIARNFWSGLRDWKTLLGTRNNLNHNLLFPKWLKNRDFTVSPSFLQYNYGWATISSRINGVVKHYDIKLFSVTAEPSVLRSHPRRVWGGLHDEPKEGIRGRLPCAISLVSNHLFPVKVPYIS